MKSGESKNLHLAAVKLGKKLKRLVNNNFALENEKYASFKKLISGLLPQSQEVSKKFSCLLFSFPSNSCPCPTPINKTNRCGSLIVDPLLLYVILQCRKPHKECSLNFFLQFN